ncbi:MAG: chemotaxis protein CheW [Candidatus Lambdaproteobacteria bacterium]|nr:chemotaxis protein CheW [Candidatus Lambdaproteobacteria bacterium]
MSPMQRKAVFDWDRVRARLDAVAKALAGAGAYTPEQARAVLEERASALAQPLALAVSAAGAGTYIEFGVAGERFALDLACLHGSAKPTAVAPAPGAPPHVRGFVAWRGEMLPLIDLPVWLGAGQGTVQGRVQAPRYVVVLGEARPECALAADSLDRMPALHRAALQAPPASLKGPRTACVLGITTEGTTVLDGATLLGLMIAPATYRRD